MSVTWRLGMSKKLKKALEEQLAKLNDANPSNDEFVAFEKIIEDFQFKIPETIRSAIAPTLGKLQDSRGIQLAVLVTSDSQVTYTTKDIDQIGFKANLQALKSVANDMMAAAGDTMNQIWLDPTPKIRILVQRMSNEQGTLVVKCTNNKNNVEFIECQQAINEAIDTLNKISFLMSGMEVSTG